MLQRHFEHGVQELIHVYLRFGTQTLLCERVKKEGQVSGADFIEDLVPEFWDDVFFEHGFVSIVG